MSRGDAQHRGPARGHGQLRAFGTASAADARRQVKRMSPRIDARKRIRVWAIALAVPLLLTGCSFAPRYPDQVVTPEVIGILETKTFPTSGEAFSMRVTLTNGGSITLQDDAHQLRGCGPPSDLVLYATQPETWYLCAAPSSEGMYRIIADAAFSEDDAVILVYEELPGIGIKLPKADDFAEAMPAYEQVDGHLRYSGTLGGYTEYFQVNAEGQVVWHG
jgi:hypothetical protein